MDPVITAPELPDVNVGVAGGGDFELFFGANVEPEKEMAYILMMATDCIQDFNIKTLYPYNEFLANRKLGGGGWVRKLSANKDIVVQELMRRDPNAKPNKSNRSCEELLRLFKPLTDSRDIDFVVKKELEVRQKLESMLGELNTKRVSHDVKEKAPKRPKIEKKVGLADAAANVNLRLKLDDSSASIAMEAAEKAARDNDFKVTIAIVNAEGVPMLVKRLEGANPHSFDLAIAKAKTSCLFQRNSSQLQDFPDISRGGVPLMANGVCMGGVGVSGDKQPNCEKVAYAAVDRLVEDAKQESDLKAPEVPPMPPPNTPSTTV
eukprot:scaffold1394_cov150-Skeletonema_menzelii.AAC.8